MVANNATKGIDNFVCLWIAIAIFDYTREFMLGSGMKRHANRARDR